MIARICLFSLLFSLGQSLLASTNSIDDYKPKGPSDEQIEEMAIHNTLEASGIDSFIMRSDFTRAQNIIPFAEYETTGFLLFSDDDFYGMAKEIKYGLAKSLPPGVDLIIYTHTRSKRVQKRLIKQYSNYIDKERVKLLVLPRSGSNNFWTRDNLPMPVFSDGEFSLVDAKYYYNFEPDFYFGELFSTPLLKHQYYFEGGNFMANRLGDCIIVNRKRSYPGGVSDTAAIPDYIFQEKYGCQKLLRLEHLRGIGHADEVVKFMSDNIVVTDVKEYIPILEREGYQVVLMPEANLKYETYINSVIVNDTLFVPVFGEQTDQKAIALYQSLNLGYKIVPLKAKEIATKGQGGIHCITMNYPSASLYPLSKGLGATIIDYQSVGL